MPEVHWIRDQIKVEVEGDLVCVTSGDAWTYEVTQEYFALLDTIRGCVVRTQDVIKVDDPQKQSGVGETHE